MSSETDVKNIINKYPYIVEVAKRLRETKLKVLNDLSSYIDKTIKSVEAKGGNAYLAKDSQEARRIVGELVGENKKIVFSKTNASLEIRLRDYLQEKNNEAWETDLGEFLLQLTGGWPAHIVTPALGLTRREVGKILNRIDKSINEESSIVEMVAAARKFLISKFLEADVGITGANSISGDTGSIVLVENEGNIRMDTVLPRMHIAIVGVDKIVPTLRDAIDEAIVQAAYAGSFPPTYINVTSGPSATEDIEQIRISPSIGPEKFNIILLDNGRTAANKNPDVREALLCIKCGRCYFSCPIYRVLGKDWVSTKSPYNGPMGVMWNYIVNQDPLPASYCIHSGGCKEVCPMEINIPAIIQYIKAVGARNLK